MTRYTYETKRPCSQCRRDVDAVRASGEPAIRHSRHLHRDGVGFCDGSLVPLPMDPPRSRR